MTRTILYTGKGGVGKTTVAAATALRAARQGKSVLILSTDPAHSLADSFDMHLGPDPTPITENLWGEEIDVLREMDEHWGTIQKWISELLAWQGASRLVANEVAVFPGMDELAGLLDIVRRYESQTYDVIVVDCAPTGETLRLLSFPETAKWYMDHIFPVERKATSILRPVIRSFSRIPMPTDDVFQAGQRLFEGLERMRSILSDPEHTSVRLVMNPEKMVIKETRRTYTYLNLYGYFTDLVIANRILPSSVQDVYFQTWRASQQKNLKLIDESFGELPLLKAPLMDQEVVGLQMLDRFADELFGTKDPVEFQRSGQMEEVRETADGFEMRLSLPFTEKRDVNLSRYGDEVVIDIGQHRRNVILPNTLARCEISQAKMEDGVLRLLFTHQKAA